MRVSGGSGGGSSRLPAGSLVLERRAIARNRSYRPRHDARRLSRHRGHGRADGPEPRRGRDTRFAPGTGRASTPKVWARRSARRRRRQPRSAEILVTMLSDGPTTAAAVDGALQAGLVWAQMGTVGIDWTQRLADLAARRRHRFSGRAGDRLDTRGRVGRAHRLRLGHGRRDRPRRPRLRQRRQGDAPARRRRVPRRGSSSSSTTGCSG